MMSKSNKVHFVVVIGETGAGKSTFVNYVANAFHRKLSLDELQVIIPNEYYRTTIHSKMKDSERVLDDPTLSKTTECQRYTFPLSTGRGSLVFIDTPGLGDTSGYLKDNENVEKIFKTIKSLEYISAVILVINGTTTRITSNVSNVLVRFRQFFPDSIYTNMIVVFTNCQSYNKSFDESSLNLPSTCRYFCMQNSIYCRPFDQIKAHRTIFEKEFNESIKAIREIIEHVRKLQPQSTKAFANLDDERYRLQAILHEAYLMILQMEQVENELESLTIAADLQRTNVAKLLETSQITVLRTASGGYYNMICMKCNKVCHKNCKLNEISSNDHNPISTCSVMRNRRCTECRCSIEQHYYSSKDLEKVNLSIAQSIIRAREQLKYEQEDRELTLSKLDSFEAMKTEIPKLLDCQRDLIRQTCMNLKKSCQNINIAQELIHFNQILNQCRQQFRSPLVIDRLDKLVNELQRIASGCEQAKNENVGINPYSNIQTQNSAEAVPPVSARTRNKREAPTGTPTYYQPDSEPERRSSPNLTQKSHPQRYSAYSTDQLICEHRGLVAMKSPYTERTAHELQKRAQGSSVGFLNRCELAQFANYYADCRQRDKNDLQEEYDKLAGRIDADIHQNVSNLACVEPNDLLKIAALSLLINPVTPL